ncbi:MAG: glycosyltransferase family 1 protein [Candidatus Sumerlaeia bacterium]|nr:glycosyltransferase family 1 protein [Candidatus Sumerlaeia bacterium]
MALLSTLDMGMTVSLADYDMLCLSHLRWETTLFQRPQQLMLQFDAMGIRVFYLSQWSTRKWAKALLSARRRELRGRAGGQLLWHNLPYLPGVHRSPLFEHLNFRLFGAAARMLATRRCRRPLLLWVYHPAAAQMLDRIPHKALVYDCMDPFVAFRAERIKDRIERHECELLRRADVVFTGGLSLQAAKEGRNPRTYCFPSGVDLDHFGRALDGRARPAPDVARLPHPIFGYWGAVDERMDFDLLEALCRRFPRGSVVLIGPLVGMALPPVTLSNFHYLGAREYAVLPDYLAAFDVCLLPFAATALTASISPTKTPEYLAGGRPVVSTHIPDVAQVWGDVVAVAATHEAFLELCERELARPRPDPRLADAARSRAATWDSIARTMREKIEIALAGRS